MATNDTTAIAYQLKRIYGDKITDLFNRQAMTYNLFMKSSRRASVKPAGAGYYFAVRTGAMESVGARVEGAFLPEPLPTAGVQGSINPALIYAVCRMSGLALEAGKGNLAAFVDAQGDAVMDSYKSLVVDLNRMCWGDGFGLLGTTSAAATPATASTWTATFDNDRGTRYIRKGMICDFYQSGTLDVTASAVRVSAINPTTKVVTFEAIGAAGTAYRTYHPNAAGRTATKSTASIASGSYLIRYGAREAAHAITDTPRELMGLLGMYDDGTLLTSFEGINTSTYPEWVANRIHNSAVNREITEDLMLSAMDMSSTRSNNSQVDTIRMGLGQRRKYFGLLKPDVRYSAGVLLGGYERLDFSQNGRVKIIVDPFSQPNRMFFEPDNAIKKYELTPVGWGGFEPQKMHWRENYDEATMFLRTYCNLGVEDRRSLTVIEDLEEPDSMPF